MYGDTEHPGAASHRALVDAVTACLPPPRRTPTTAQALATELWASLHGIVDLRITKPELPWPNPDLLTDLALAAVRDATGAGPSRPDAEPTEPR